MKAAACLLLSCAAGCAGYRAYVDDDPLAGTVRWFVEEKSDDACVVGLVDAEHPEPVYAAANCTEHSLFRVASLTKVMLDPVIDSLVRDGDIDLDRPVADCYGGRLADEYGSVTLRELYEHRSELPREFIDPWCLGDVFTAFHCGFAGIDIYEGFGDRTRFEGKLGLVSVRADVRRRVPRYSCMGFALLMMGVADALCTTVDALADERLVKAFALHDTAFEPKGDQTNRLTRACSGALPWLVRRGKDVPDHRLGEVARVTGGLKTSASDLLRLAPALWPKVDALAASVPPGLGAGEELTLGLLNAHRGPDGRLFLFRHGMIYGGASFVGFDPKDRRMLVILRNVTSWPSSEGYLLLCRLAR